MDRAKGIRVRDSLPRAQAMSHAYYNENDPFAAAWLRELIADGLIAPGEVDDRSIADVRADDLRGFTQCHFFAGIGVWSHGLRLAGWPDEREVWTGSCPCQPFSAAGKGEGYADERHLWPHWYRLIGECRPATIFGEQVAAAIRTGWLDDVCLSLESLGYAVGAVDFPACSVGAPHIRQRVYFVADSMRTASERGAGSVPRAQAQSGVERQQHGHSPIGLADGCETRPVADAECDGGRTDEPGRQAQGRVVDGWRSELGDAKRARLEGHAGHGDNGNEPGWKRADETRSTAEASSTFWSDAEWLPCRDGKARPAKPGIFPLAHGATARVGRLRAYGNAIVPQAAAEIIRAFMEVQP
jgi:DNA (cytosine-5)-methyltransferase 1